jgi:hypothetical protein
MFSRVSAFKIRGSQGFARKNYQKFQGFSRVGTNKIQGFSRVPYKK